MSAQKLNSKERENPAQCEFDSLPFELYLKIFEHLSVKTIFNLRLVNKHFLNLIDHIDSIWHHLCLKLDLDEKSAMTITSKMDIAESILYNMPNIRMIDIKCAHFLSADEITAFEVRCNQKGGLLSGELLYSIRFSILNTQSIVECFNLVSNCSQKLIVDSFYEPNSQLRLTGQKRRQLKFNHLTSLDLNCIISKRIDVPNYYQQSNEFIKTLILNRLDTIFPNLNRLHLRLFIYSCYSLYQTLCNLLNLHFIEFHTCWINGSNESDLELDKLERKIISAERKLKIESYLFRSVKFAGIRMYLEYFTDLNCLTRLSLFNLSLGAHEFQSLFDLLMLRLENLKCFATDLFQTNTLNEIFDADTYHIVDKIFSRLDELSLCDCNSYYDDFKASRRGRYLANYNYRFDLNDFLRLFGESSYETSVNKLLITFVEDCCTCDEKSIEKLTKIVVDYFTARKSCLKCVMIHLKIKCESLVFKNCDAKTCTLNNLTAYLRNSEYFKSIKIYRNSIKIELT